MLLGLFVNISKATVGWKSKGCYRHPQHHRPRAFRCEVNLDNGPVLRPSDLQGCSLARAFGVPIHQGVPQGIQVQPWGDMRRDSIVLVRSIYRVNKAVEKNPEFDAFMDDFEVLKFELRLSMDLHLISIRKYAEISRLVDSIGRQINGWRKSFR